VSVDREKDRSGALGALASGTSMGVKLIVNIAAMLLVFIGIVALLNYISSDIIGRHTGINEWVRGFTGGKSDGLTFQFIVGIVLAPFMWITGVPLEDITTVGSLLGQKTILNEFVAYAQMEEWKTAGMFVYEKSMIMSTYILCGFANISSIGILLGGMSVLAPGKKEMIIRLGFPAMIGGALVSVMSATIVGMIMG
ncbi:MAG: Na+ dependent nucleoside transporter, partial [Tannerellaceae bacterium]|nr:Na+ dependent nucleoside transporter [Tannerellaceae bacterium]